MDLLERTSQLDELHGLLRRARGGSGCLVAIGGEAGAGKSSLVNRFAETARQSAEVMIGTCDPLAVPRPLGPLFDIASALSPLVRTLLGEPERRPDLFRMVLDDLVAHGPVFLVIEDVHWADEATLDLLRFLGRRIDESQVLLGVTYRDDEVTSGHPLRAVLGDLASTRTVRRIAVPLLSRAAVVEMSRDTTLDPERLYLSTDGNPFYVSEIIAAGDETIPETIRDAVLARASRLSEAGRAALDLAAVIGARIELMMLHGIMGEAAAPIDEALGAGLLRARDGVLEFRHQLVQAAVADALSPGRSRDLHGRVLRAMRANPARATDHAALAHHAEASGDEDAVLMYAPAAAARAAALGAHREAAGHYECALCYAATELSSERMALLGRYILECRAIGDQGKEVASIEALLALARASGDRNQEATALGWMAMYLNGKGRNAESDAAIEAAVTLVADMEPERSHAFVYATQAWLRMLDRDTDLAVTWGERAAAVAERFGDTRTLIRVKTVIGSARLVGADLETGREELEESLALAHEHNQDDLVASALGNLGSGLGEVYALDSAEAYLTDAIAFAAARDQDALQGYAVAWLGLVRLYRGAWSEAADLAESVIRNPGAMTIGRMMALVTLGRVRTRRGDPDAAAALDDALELIRATGTLQRLAPVHAARAEAAWLAGNRERTADEARVAFDLAVRKQHRWFMAELGYWRWKAGDLTEAPEGNDTPFALQVNGDWAGAAKMWRDLGCPYETARALSESGDEGALREAFATFERLGARPAMVRVSRSLSDLGVHAVPRGPRSSTRANPARLTSRELDVLRLLTLGNTNAEIAAALFVSPKTIEHHVSAILSKLAVRTRRDAVRAAADLAIFS
ncbi:MAG: AAA family ATPase [Chloroflexota bacterium]|nr:AAA family ATPase [Chloroflexota bacterium]